jgi:phage-related protein
MRAVAANKPVRQQPKRYRRQWRFYRSAAGREPVREFLAQLSEEDAAAVAAAMKEVRNAGRGHVDVNHLRGDIWQIEVDGKTVIYRVLFAEEGRFSQVLLALEIVNKKWRSAKADTFSSLNGAWQNGVHEADQAVQRFGRSLETSRDPTRHIVHDMAALCHAKDRRSGRVHQEADRNEP